MTCFAGLDYGSLWLLRKRSSNELLVHLSYFIEFPALVLRHESFSIMKLNPWTPIEMWKRDRKKNWTVKELNCIIWWNRKPCHQNQICVLFWEKLFDADERFSTHPLWGQSLFMLFMYFKHCNTRLGFSLLLDWKGYHDEAEPERDFQFNCRVTMLSSSWKVCHTQSCSLSFFVVEES